MDLQAPGSNMEDDDVFFDALDDCLFHHCTGEDPQEPSSPSSLCEPQPLSSPATSIRRRSICSGFPGKVETDLDFDSCTGSDSNLINGAKTSSHHQPIYRNPGNLKENSEENENFPEKCDSNSVREEEIEESTLTTSTDSAAAGDSSDLVAELGDSSLNLHEYIAGLVIKAIEFQIKLFIMFITYPVLFIFHSCMFFIEPFGTMRRGVLFVTGIFSRVWGVVVWCIGPSVHGWFKEHKSIWSVAFRCGWSFLWSIFVCCIFFALLVSSLVISGFLMKFLVEKPIQMRQILNFDYTKQNPVAYVPIISCAGVNGGQDYENNIAVGKWMDERVIPSKHKLQLTVSLQVPESGYNQNLGVFQVRVDLLSSGGKNIASSSQPCMLRFKSVPIRLIMTFLEIAPLLTGYTSETQTLNVKMKGFVEGDVPTSCLKVTLEQRALCLPGDGIPEIYDASTVIESELPFFKRIIWNWKAIIFIWITVMAFMMEFLFVLVCCSPIIIWRAMQRSGSARGTDARNNIQARR